ncbi:MAG: hypothetical protein SFY96_12595 [Planctomycetota bacterium]|nr:hypothetical protein [Planctomycetota bacterium]
MDKSKKSKHSRTISPLAQALERISERIAKEPSQDTLLLAVSEEADRPGADAKSINRFGKILFDAIERRGEPKLPDDISKAIDNAVRDVLGRSASR